MNLRAVFGELAPSSAGERFPWRFVAIISILLMELSIITPWIKLIVSGLETPATGALMLWFLLLALAAHWLHRLQVFGSLPGVLLIALSVIVFAVGALISLNVVDGSRSIFDLAAAARVGLTALLEPVPIPPEIPILIAAVLVWRRGVASASPSSLEQGRTGFKFRLGVLIFLVFALISGKGQVSAALPLFFFSGLLAMSLTRANHIASQRSGGDPPFTASWLLSLIGLFLVTLLSGMVTGRVLNTPLIDQAFAGLRQLALRLFLFIYQLILPLLLVVDSVFQRLVSRLAQQPQAAEQDLLSELGQAGGDWIGGDPPWLIQQLTELAARLSSYWPTIRIGLVLLVFLFIFITSIRAVVRARQGASQTDGGDEGEDISISPSRGLRGRLGDLGRELGSWGRAVVSGQLSTAIVVRRLYARLLSLAEEYGRSRYRWETPLEFELALGRLFPERKPEIKTLTEAYIRVRYGQIAETSDLVQQVRQAWQGIQDEYR